MNGGVAPVHAAELHGHCHAGKRLSVAMARKHVVIVRGALGRLFSSWTARLVRGILVWIVIDPLALEYGAGRNPGRVEDGIWAQKIGSL